MHIDFHNLLAYIAIALLASSYWYQIYHIYIHKEVRDLSLPYHIQLAIGFAILIYTAWAENSVIFIWKQVLTTIPVLVIIGQILYHRKDHWHDDKDPYCTQCANELELDWSHCPYCGHAKFL